MKLLVLIALVLLPLCTWSFPENIRHSYLNCTTCHVSPSGGGVLNPYGKSLSAELMSTWGSSKTAGFFFTNNEDESINPPWFRGNVFLRGVQTRRNTATFEKAQFFPMQADFEGGYDTDKYAIIAAIGLRAKDLSLSKDLEEVFSRRHYVLYRLSDSWALRGGKFLFSFGLGGPDHVTATRRGLGFDQGTESYNLELSYSGEKVSTLFSVVDSTPVEKVLIKDKGVAINQSYLISPDSKIGFSGFVGEQTASRRSVVGPHWIWSISKNLYLESEIFYQQKIIKADTSTQNGYATFHRASFEITKGLIAFAQFDRSFLNTADEVTKYDSYGPGLRWLPYPHFEFLSYLGKEKAFGQDASDYWWVMFNIYL